MILELDDAVYAADQFIDYFSNMGRIDEYLRNIKLERMEQIPTSILGLGPEDDMFDDFDMHPQDMNFKVYVAGEKGGFTNEYFLSLIHI
jgi:hypothetical protein